jgi:TonB family protein
MLRLAILGAVLALAPVLLGASAGAQSGDVVRIGRGVTPPRLLRKVVPKYSGEARANHIQGTVVLQIVVSAKGRATDIKVLSPLGFGLDEQAEAAVAKWEFSPGTKDGHPVNVSATIEVNFRLSGLQFDEKNERRRSAFNIAIETLKRTDAQNAAVSRAVGSVEELCRKKYPPAMYVVGMWEMSGDHVAKDPSNGLGLIQGAAARNYAPALYEIGVRMMDGRGLSKDTGQGMKDLRDAAVLGNVQAQFYLGALYGNGNGVPRDAGQSRRYFRLCAAQGVPVCQYRLGRSLLNESAGTGRDSEQAIAWLELASEHGLQDAKDIVSKEAARLTPEQVQWVNALKKQLVHK